MNKRSRKQRRKKWINIKDKNNNQLIKKLNKKKFNKNVIRKKLQNKKKSKKHNKLKKLMTGNN